MMTNPFEIIEARLSSIETLLQEIKQAPKESAQPEADELLTVQATAEFLKLSVPTVYGLISKGEIPFMKRSKRCYFSKLELINYLKQGRKNTKAIMAIEVENFLISKRK